jgi:hypothetical protein
MAEDIRCFILLSFKAGHAVYLDSCYFYYCTIITATNWCSTAVTITSSAAFVIPSAIDNNK